jgi:hypothetical protein
VQQETLRKKGYCYFIRNITPHVRMMNYYYDKLKELDLDELKATYLRANRQGSFAPSDPYLKDMQFLLV